MAFKPKAPKAKSAKKAPKAGMINPAMPNPKGGNIAALRKAQFSRMQKGY